MPPPARMCLPVRGSTEGVGMSQNINLYSPLFRRRRRVLTLATLAQCLGVLLAVLFSYHYYLLQQVKGVSAELQGAESLLDSKRGNLKRLKDKAPVPGANAQLEAEIARYESELKIAREAMGALKGGALGHQQGFAEYLRAFSRQSVNGLWLTGFTITGGGELEIRGRVLSPELVPSYIQKLNSEQVLAGRSFARLEMNRPKPEAHAARKEAKKLPRYLEFSLATIDAATAGGAP
jgi:hypothetical protein